MMDDIVNTERDVRATITKLLSKNTNHRCLYPNCCEKSIFSHSISKSILKNISEDGHVITPVFNRNSIGKDATEWLMKSESNLQIKPIGLNSASTFNGFCKHHDNSIFSSLDNTGVITHRDIFLQLYRTACYYKFNAKMISESEMNNQGYEYYSNTELEESMQLNLSNFILFFNDLLTDFSELETPINVNSSSVLIMRPFSKIIPPDFGMNILYKKIHTRYPVALQNDLTILLNGNLHHCLIILLPHINFSSLIIACHKDVVGKFGNFITKGDIGILKLIESILMCDSNFYIDPRAYKKWSEEKQNIFSDDFYFYNERGFLDEYDVSIFDDIRLKILEKLPEVEKNTELKKIKTLPIRPVFLHRNEKMTSYNINDRRKKMNITGNKDGRCYPYYGSFFEK